MMSKYNHKLRGVSRMESLNIVLEQANKEYTDEEKLALANKKNSYYVAYLSELTVKSILPEVMEVLNVLNKRHIKIAIGSSSSNTKFILDKLKLLDSFDAIVDGTDIKNSKPDPEVFLKAAQRMELAPLNCAVVEDAIAGIDAANTADMVSFAISDANGYEKADFSLNNLKELLDVVQ